MMSEVGMKMTFLVFPALFLLLLPGCATMNVEWHDQDANLIVVSYSIADALIDRMKTKPVPFSPIVVATFVETGKVDRTSNLGRMMSDFIASRMSMSGLRIVEMRSADAVFLVRDGKDLTLSGESGGAAPAGQKAQAIVIGSYTKANTGIYVSTRIVRADNHQIISSVDLHLPLSYELMYLL